VPFLDDVLSSASYGESDRLDWVVKQLKALQARHDALSALLVAKGIVTADDLVASTPDTPAPLTNDDLDRLDVKLP
jgi:hypothetical protein